MNKSRVPTYLYFPATNAHFCFILCFCRFKSHAFLQDSFSGLSWNGQRILTLPTPEKWCFRAFGLAQMLLV